jgi:hypothetical protein
MEQLLVQDMRERIRRAELRLEQFLIARALVAPNSAGAFTADLQVNASLVLLAYLQSLLRELQEAKAA